MAPPLSPTSAPAVGGGKEEGRVVVTEGGEVLVEPGPPSTSSQG